MPEPRKALFRCDASASIGGGHVMRCLTLATEMKSRGWSVSFATTAESGEAVAALPQSGFPVHHLSDPTDPGQIVDLLTDAPVDVTVVDHYGLDARYEMALRPITGQIAVLDDLPGRPHDCDLLVDQTFERDQEDYAGIVPRHTMLLTGSDHALLRAPFARLRSASLARRQAGRVDRILVALGLTDVGGITRLVVAALLDGLRGRDLGIDVVIGGRAESRRFLETLADEEPSVTLHIDTNDMPRLIAEADIVIGAGGTTSWERCCLGAPTLLLVLADNQEDVARRLSLTGAATPFRPDALTDLVGELDALSRRPDRVQEMSKAASVICDGLGVGHVADWLEASSDAEPPTSLRARRADPDDRADVWIWRSDPQTLAHSLSAEQVPWEDHCRWWANALSDADRTLLMIGDADREIGHVRLDRLKDGALRVSVTLSPAYRGKGLGAQVLRTGLATLPTGAVAVAEIHRDNGASRRIFERCGFRRTGSDGPFDLYRATGGQQT